MYWLSDYGRMLADEDRFRAYSRAIASAVHPGDAVLEIGCGPGVFSLLACQAGARKVYAIELADVAEFARELAATNRFSDRIECIQGNSRKTELPERVNVIIADVRGVLPLYDHAIATIEDARQRFLLPGGILIPQRDTLKAALVDATECYCRLTTPWRTAVPSLDFSMTLPFILNTSYSVHFKEEQLLTDAATWGVLDYATGSKTGASAEIAFRAATPGTAHGICVWFEAKLFNEVGYSTAPGALNSVYGQMFFPWLTAVPLEHGQDVKVRLQADLVGADYVWQWETHIAGNRFAPERHFRQSTLQGAVFSPASLRRRAADFVPKLSDSGEADRWLLQAIDGKASLQEIAKSAAQRFPKVFPRWENALHRVAELAAEFSR
jgi:type I protein arginine methyltransferase